jgi:hypothetical protein
MPAPGPTDQPHRSPGHPLNPAGVTIGVTAWGAARPSGHRHACTLPAPRCCQVQAARSVRIDREQQYSDPSPPPGTRGRTPVAAVRQHSLGDYATSWDRSHQYATRARRTLASSRRPVAVASGGPLDSRCRMLPCARGAASGGVLQARGPHCRAGYPSRTSRGHRSRPGTLHPAHTRGSVRHQTSSTKNSHTAS